MYIVTNRIKVKKGFAEKMAPAFTKPSPLQSMKGFVKTEVTIRQNITDYDELNVSTYWETLADFEAWKNSDVFKEAHKTTGKKETSPVIDNEIVITKVAGTIEASSKK